METLPAKTKEGETNTKKEDAKEIQKWINSILTSQDGLQETSNSKDLNNSSTIPPLCRKKSYASDDLLTLGDEATTNPTTKPTGKNIFQKMMRKKFSEKVTGSSFNSDATSDSFQMILDSRQKSAELILRNLGFCDSTPCRQTERAVPERFFKEPSAANGMKATLSRVRSSFSVGRVNDSHLDDSKDQMSVVFDKLIRLISTEKSFTSTHNKSIDDDDDDDDEDDDDHNDEIDGQPITDDEGGTIDTFSLIQIMMELVRAKVNPNGYGTNPASASCTPPGVLRGVRVVRPSQKVTKSDTRYWTILQPYNSEYLNAIGYYDTMPTVAENSQSLDLEEQFANTLAKLQQLDRPIKKKKTGGGHPNVANGNKVDPPADLTTPHSNRAIPNEQKEAKKEGEDDGDQSPSKKIMCLPTRFLQTTSLLGNISQFIPDVHSIPHQESIDRPSPVKPEESPRRDSSRQPLLHRQSSVFSDQLSKDYEDDSFDNDEYFNKNTNSNIKNNNNNNNNYNIGDISFRFSESSYSCEGSSCSSLPRDLELERYYASKNMLRIPTAESDDVASCISDRTAVNENLTRGPSTSEGAEGVSPVPGHSDKNQLLPNLSDFKKKMKARMSRQTSSQSDSSGFGESEFVDALTHQQHAHIKSSNNPSNELGNTDQLDSSLLLQDSGSNREARLGGPCPLCLKSRDVLVMDTWTQTSLTSFRQEDAGSVLRSFRSDVTIDNGGDRPLSLAPLGSEVCLFLRDQPRRSRASTSLNIKVSSSSSKFRSHDRRHSLHVQNMEGRNENERHHITYDLLSSDDQSYLRRQSLPSPQNQSSLTQTAGFHSNLLHHLHCRHHNHNHESPTSLQRSSNFEPRHNYSRHELMEQASHLLNETRNHQEEIRRLTSQSTVQSDGPLYMEMTKQVRHIEHQLVDWCSKSMTHWRDDDGGGERSLGGELGEVRRKLVAMENVLQLMRDCHGNNSNHHYQETLSLPLSNIPLIITESSSSPTIVPPPSSSSPPPQDTPLFHHHHHLHASLNLPLLTSSSSSSPNIASSTLTEGSTESDLEKVKEKLKVMEDKIAGQDEQQELTLRILFKEFKDSLLEEVREMKKSDSQS